MDTMGAYFNRLAAEGSPTRQLDWEKAKTICEQNKGKLIYAGLREDMEWTASCIFDGEKRIKNDAYVASIWATPILKVGFKEIECWEYGEDSDMPKWWPE